MSSIHINKLCSARNYSDVKSSNLFDCSTFLAELLNFKARK